MENEKKFRVAVIAGASHALKYKEQHPRATEQEVLQYISKEAKKIVGEIDDEF